MSIKLEQATILLVDDEPALLDIVGKWLRAEGCGTVLTAPDGAVALDVLDANHVDLLITDVRMPHVDGVALVRSLVERGISLPSIIFVSGFGAVDRRAMYGLGVEAFLAKPFRRDELLTAMRHALANRSELWLTPMAAKPRQTMCVGRPALEDGGAGRLVCLGRGGFSAYHPDPLSLSKVAFECAVHEDPQVLAGEGLVRWYSRAEQTVGVEFVYLDPSCRDWVIEAIVTARPRGFIPQSPGS